MIVTDLEYHLETKLVNKLDIMIRRCTDTKSRKDAVLIIEGAEGEGKTNSSEAISYYVKHKTGRDIHMFFRLAPLIEYAKDHEGKIIIWDEPALDSLSTDWWKEVNKDLIRLLMTCRKKRHFFIFNFVKFYKFSEYVVVDRALGLINMYSRKGVTAGRFSYIRVKNLEKLWNDFRNKRQRNYIKYRSFGGAFPIVEDIMGKMGITIEGEKNCDLAKYEELKDIAIGSISERRDKVGKFKKKYEELRHLVGNLKCPINTNIELASQLNISTKTLGRWGKYETSGD